MIGKFGFRQNCSIPHFIPEGEWKDGHPVIVFPKETAKAVIGKTYEFELIMTRAATYTIDGLVYRVAHAIGLRDVSGKEGDHLFDYIFHRHAGPPNPTGNGLGDHIDPATRAKLEALKAGR